MARTNDLTVTAILRSRVTRLLGKSRASTSEIICLYMFGYDQPMNQGDRKRLGHATPLAWMQAEMLHHGVIESAEDIPSYPSSAAAKRALKTLVAEGTLRKVLVCRYGYMNPAYHIA